MDFKALTSVQLSFHCSSNFLLLCFSLCLKQTSRLHPQSHLGNFPDMWFLQFPSAFHHCLKVLSLCLAGFTDDY